MTTSTQSNSNNNDQPFLPGRLSDPNNVLQTDPRADPRMVAALAPFELDIAPAPAPVTADSSLQEKLDYITEAEIGFEGLFAALYTDLPPIEDVDRRTEVIKGEDDNDISLYIHKPKNDNNRLCWPYFAKSEDLQGLPPHVISVNQLDPLRDEGLKYYRMLLAAGVSAYSRTVNGTSHAGDMIFRQALPEVYAATIRDIKGFADSL